MSCDKCTDIHKAQKEGKTQNGCKCNCHDSWTGTNYFDTTSTTGTITFTDCGSSATTFDVSGNQLNVTTSVDVCTCVTDTINQCPVHNTNKTGDG